MTKAQKRPPGGPSDPSTQPQKLAVVMKQISEIQAHPSNVRIHSTSQIVELCEIIKAVGYLNPILVNPNGQILAGHARWQACKRLSMNSIPVIVISGLSEAQTRAYILADNKLVEKAGWDRQALATELQQLAPLLGEAGFSIELTGFEMAEIDGLLVDLADPETDNDESEASAPDIPVSAIGDLWELGPHRLLCADSRELSRFAELLQGERAALAFTDPPYNVRISKVQGRGRTKHREFEVASGEMSREEFTQFLLGVLKGISQYATDGAIIYVCMDWRHLREMVDAGEAVFGVLKNLVVWNKTNAGMGTFYRSQHELIFVFKNGDAAHVNNFELGQHGRNRSNVWTYAGPNSANLERDSTVHPSKKPIALVADAIKDCSRRGDIILDPFMGSGTTIMAAEQVGRRCYGMEIDPLYVDAAIKRWQRATKREAVLKSTGETFAEVAAARLNRDASSAVPPLQSRAVPGRRRRL